MIKTKKPYRPKKPFRGDASHLLPAQKIEPYRLWFEFLKLALKDQTLTVDKAFYEPWGPVADADFDDWWVSHWQDLFAVDIGVRVCGRDERANDRELLVKVPLYQHKARTLRQLGELLDQHGVGDRLIDIPPGQFGLSVGVSADGHPTHPSIRFLRNLPKVRLLLHLYRYWLEGQGLGDRRRLEQTAMRYFKWADAWNTKIEKTSRPRIEIPHAISAYVAFLEQRGNRKRIPLSELNDTDVPNHRRQIKRYIRKALHIAGNVARGEFPGRYDHD